MALYDSTRPYSLHFDEPCNQLVVRVPKRELSIRDTLYAVEGQTFVVAPSSVAGPATLKTFCDTDLKRQLLQLGGGFARVYGPEGSLLSQPLPETEEGIVYADLPADLIAIAKSAADPVGHHSRPDVLRLLVNRNPAPRVVATPREEAPAAEEFAPAAVSA